jgi:hypothetical protein
MTRLAIVASALVGCLPVWRPAGLYGCTDGGCAAGFVCDDGVCCLPGQTPACPTLPFEGRCDGGSAPITFFRDADNDGFGDARNSQGFCAKPSRSAWVLDAGDCQDTTGAINPSQEDACNGVDDDCDGIIDNDRAGLNRRTVWFRDADLDGFGAGSATVMACAAPPGSGLAPVGGDCDDSRLSVNPGAPELCNGADDNCNGLRDEGPFTSLYRPGEDINKASCTDATRPPACQAANRRCVNAQEVCVSRVVPETERCDGVDNDCNGEIDERPGCGGPERLAFASGTVSARTVRLPPFLGLVGRCIGSAGEVPRTAVWAPPFWVTSMEVEPNANQSAGFVHVWRLTAPPGQTWDLGGRSVSLALPLQLSDFVSAPDNVGLWFDAQRLQQPLINLCDENDRLARQLRPTTVTLPEADAGRAVWLAAESLPLTQAADGGWVVVAGDAGLSAIKSFELVISNRALVMPTASNQTFTTIRVNFLDAGFRGGP